jgi:hypothetical protein
MYGKQKKRNPFCIGFENGGDCKVGKKLKVDFSFRTNGIFFVSLDVLFLLNLKIFCC